MDAPIVRLHASTGRPVTTVVEAVLACAWSVRILRAIQAGHRDHRALVRALSTIPKRTLTHRLGRLQQFGILRRVERDQVPPRVLYAFTPFGSGFMDVLDAIHGLDRRVSAGEFPELAGTVRGETP